ncbi:MAG: hypothetical protein ACR2M6_02625 [Vampirovibrionia bacterium]
MKDNIIFTEDDFEGQLIDALVSWINNHDIESRVQSTIKSMVESNSKEVVQRILFFDVGFPQFYVKYADLLVQDDYSEIIKRCRQ